MSTITTTLTPVTLIAAGTSNAANGATRAATDMRGMHGGLLTAKITNGGTGPTAQAVARVYIAHDSGTTPATGAAGSTWKLLAILGGGGTTASAVTEISMLVPPCCHLQIEVGDNTAQAVTCEAYLTKYIDYQSA